MDYALMVAGPSFTVGVAEQERESGKVTASHCDSNEVSADLPESRHVSADLPESRHVSADLPESRHVSAVHPESLHVSSVHPKSIHVSAVRPESLLISAQLRHIIAGHPETCHILSVTPRYPRPVHRVPSLVSSVRNAPLVFAHAAGNLKPTYTNPLAPELFPYPRSSQSPLQSPLRPRSSQSPLQCPCWLCPYLQSAPESQRLPSAP